MMFSTVLAPTHMTSHNPLYMYIKKKSMKQVNKNILYEKVGGI